MAKITIESEGKGVLFNGALVGARGWAVTFGTGNKVTFSHKESGVSGTATLSEIEVDGVTHPSKAALLTALGTTLFSSDGTGPGSGVQSVTGDGVDNTDPKNPVISYPEPSDIGAVSTSDVVDVAEAGKVVKYSNIGAVNTVNPQFPENAVNLAYHNSSMANKVDVLPGMGLSKENFTTEEKLKLAGVEDPKFKGQYLSLPDLLATGNGEVGGYAYVDNGVTVDMYIWDNTNEQWDIVVGESTTETPSSIKSKYESNPDTNAFTNVLKDKLEAFTANFTSALKIAYDNAVSWISANGVNLLNHLSNKSNPHDVTASQVGLGNVDNTKDIDKPMSTATKNYVDSFVGKAWIPDYSNMEDTNRITSTGGTWTSDRKGFVYVLSRGYNSGIYHTQVAFINDKEVGKIWVEAVSTGNARSGSFANIYPVKPGDVIKLYGNLEVKCLFIPGIWV